VNGAAALAPGTSAATSEITVTIVGTSLSAVVDASGFFQLTGVPSGDVQMQFQNATMTATVQIRNVGEGLIEIQVQVTGNSATVVSEVRSNEKVALCHATGNGSYHLIDVSTSAEPAHRAHGDGKVGDPVPGTQNQTFGQNCQVTGPAVAIEKSTNGEDADDAPGPTIPVGAAVTWQYFVTNTGTLNLTGVQVTDDKNVAVSCPSTSLMPGQSMTCSESGTATQGQYRNVGTVTATSTSGNVTASDASHYFGQAPGDETDGPTVQLCHRTGNGSYVPIEVSVSAESAHRAHGDGQIGEGVPGSPGKVFGAGCSVN
jgi:hypothetical protein